MKKSFLCAGAALLLLNLGPALANQCVETFVTSPLEQAKAIEKKRAPRLADIKRDGVKDLDGRNVKVYLKPRERFSKPSTSLLRDASPEFTQIVVKFEDDTLATASGGRVRLPSNDHRARLNAVLERFPDFSFEADVKGGEEFLNALRFCAADNTGHDFPDLTAFFVANISPGQHLRAVDLVESLLQLPEVETAWLRPRMLVAQTPPAVLPDIEPRTGQHDDRQTYFGAAPNGINIRDVWTTTPSARGEGIRYVDFEFGWTLDHEDLPAPTRLVKPNQAAPAMSEITHGTAVVGILSARHTPGTYEYGTKGGVPLAQSFVAQEYYWGLAELYSAERLRAGDVLVIELALKQDPLRSAGGCQPIGGPAYPIELDDAYFSQIQQLTANGVIVFEPAGNGGFDLDAPCFMNRVSRGGRDSGAVMVGMSFIEPITCVPPLTLSFEADQYSNYGSRIDANAWGRCVTTTGDGYWAYGGDWRQTYQLNFSGTSAATPMVASAGIAYQSWQRARTGRVFNGVTIRSLLQRFGTSMTGTRFIGKQPDVGLTLAWLSADDDGDGLANGDELSLAQNLIDHYYMSILRRPADPGGKIYWLGEIERMRSLGVDPREAYRALSKQFFGSNEYRNFNSGNQAFVTDLYRTYFQRDPDEGGFNYWLNQISAGLNRESVLLSFMHSPEFTSFMNTQLTANPLSAERKLVLDIYRGMFARLPDTGGFNYYRTLLCSAIGQGNNIAGVAQQANSIIAAFFPYSAEYQARGRAPGESISDLYDTFFGRGADLGGFQYWVGELGTYGPEAVRNRFMDPNPAVNPEWYNRLSLIASQPCN